MSERLDFKKPLQDTDTPVIGVFGGLSTASTALTGNITHQQKLVNAFINKRNEINRRGGSELIANVQNLTASVALSTSSFFFSFDDVKYSVTRVAYDLIVSSYDDAGMLVDSKPKYAVFNTGVSAEACSFSVVIEDVNCFVYCASKNSAPVILCLLARKASLASLPTPTTPSLTIGAYPSLNVIDISKVFLYDAANQGVVVSAASQSSFTINITTATPLNGTVGSRLKLHLCFVCIGSSASYYPGSYYFNTANRKNTFPVDVNVKIPVELASMPLLSEPINQDLGINSLQAMQTNGASPVAYTRVYNRQPTTVSSFEFSDGSYRVDPSLLTVRTPAYLSFGGLQTPTADTTVYMFRLRSTATVLSSFFVARSYLKMYINKVLFTGAMFYNEAGAVITDDSQSISYVSVNSAVLPGLDLSAVVELIYTYYPAYTQILDLTPGLATINIDDRYNFPLYGISSIANVGNVNYPDIVQTIGNRVVLAGIGNKILISDGDWTYRGISWNNFQVSTINFLPTSAYLISLTQSTSVVRSVISVNGVIVVGTDSGIYRVSGDSALSPPSATVANVSRISNELVLGQSSMVLYNSQIFYLSRNGLYFINFNRDIQELNTTALSAEVSNFFTANTANTITYSNFYRAFIISFLGSNDLLMYFIETESFAVFSVGADCQVFALPSLDGFEAIVNTTNPTLFHICYLQWNSISLDFSNAVTKLPPLSLLQGKSQTFTATPSVNTLKTPAELLVTLNPALVQCYGYDTVRSTIGSVLVTDGAVNNTPVSIISAFVSKDFSQNSLLGANRVRAMNLLCKGSGSVKARIVYQSKDYNDHLPDIQSTSFNEADGFSGESLLNYQYAEKNPVGDVMNVRFRVFGVSEAWAVAVIWTGGISWLGYQMDSAAKKKGRLR